MGWVKKYDEFTHMEPQTTSPQDPQVVIPFYANWLFWVLMFLVFVLGFILYEWFAPYIYKPLVLDVKKSGDSVYVHVKKLIAPTNGFLVVTSDKNDQSEAILESSPYILKDTYFDFKIPFVVRDPNDTDFYSKLVTSGKFFVTYYVDDNYDGIYNDNNVSKDFFGRRLEVIVDSGYSL